MQCGAPAHCGAQVNCAAQASTMIVTDADLNWDGIPDVLQRLQFGFGASVQYGIDMNCDGIPDVLEQPQLSYAAPVQWAAPAVTFSLHSVSAAPAPVRSTLLQRLL